MDFVATKALNASEFKCTEMFTSYVTIYWTMTLKRVAMIQRMNMKVITLVYLSIMHEIKEISILYNQSVLANCLSLPD